MKDADLVVGRTVLTDAERFQEEFNAQQKEIEDRLSASDKYPPKELENHFDAISKSIQALQQFYSSASPYIRIYDRKICQESLQVLTQRLQDVETRLIPRKKFTFKTKKSKLIPCIENTNGTSNNTSEYERPIDVIDFPNDSLFCDRTDEVVIVPGAAILGKAVSIARLRNCTVQVLGSPSTLHITDVAGCSISCGPVSTSIFVEGAHTCNMQLSCQQLRIHQSTDTAFRIHVTSKAIIEDSTELRFGVYSFHYPTITEDYELSGLRRDINNWCDVDDFNWLVSGQQSPNWCLMSAEDS